MRGSAKKITALDNQAPRRDAAGPGADTWRDARLTTVLSGPAAPAVAAEPPEAARPAPESLDAPAPAREPTILPESDPFLEIERALAAPPAFAAKPAAAAKPDAAKPAAGSSAHWGAGLATGVGILAALQLGKTYGKRQVVKDVSLNVQRGEAVGLLGANGAGKTTAFYMITGLVQADKGAIILDGRDITHLPMYRRARLGIGYLPQEASIFRGLTVENNIRAVLEVVESSKKKREAELDALLDEFHITALRKAPAIALSGGERRRVEIARALAVRPSFMLLDEPFAGIDPIAVGDIQALVRHLTKRGIGVLITDHNVRETLGLVDRAYIMHSGQLLMEGSPAEVIANEAVRRSYLGEGFRL